MNYINAREHNCHLSRPVCSGLPFGLAHSGPSLWLEAPARDGQTFIYIALISAIYTAYTDAHNFKINLLKLIFDF